MPTLAPTPQIDWRHPLAGRLLGAYGVAGGRLYDLLRGSPVGTAGALYGMTRFGPAYRFRGGQATVDIPVDSSFLGSHWSLLAFSPAFDDNGINDVNENWIRTTNPAASLQMRTAAAVDQGFLVRVENESNSLNTSVVAAVGEPVMAAIGYNGPLYGSTRTFVRSSVETLTRDNSGSENVDTDWSYLRLTEDAGNYITTGLVLMVQGGLSKSEIEAFWADPMAVAAASPRFPISARGAAKKVWLWVGDAVASRAELNAVAEQYPTVETRIATADVGFWWRGRDSAGNASQYLTGEVFSMPEELRDDYFVPRFGQWDSTDSPEVDQGVLEAYFTGTIGDLDLEPDDVLVFDTEFGYSFFVQSDSAYTDQVKQEVLELIANVRNFESGLGTGSELGVLYGSAGTMGRDPTNAHGGADKAIGWAISEGLTGDDDTQLFGERNNWRSGDSWANIIARAESNEAFLNQHLDLDHPSSRGWRMLVGYANNCMLEPYDPAVVGTVNEGVTGGWDYWRGWIDGSLSLLPDDAKTVVTLRRQTTPGAALNDEDPGETPFDERYIREQSRWLAEHDKVDAVSFFAAGGGSLDSNLGNGVTMRDQLHSLYEGVLAARDGAQVSYNPEILSYAVDGTTADITVEVNEARESIEAVVTTSSTAPTKTQVAAGQDHTGSAASGSASLAVDKIGRAVVQVTGLSGLGTTTDYWVHLLQDNGDLLSDVVTASMPSGDTTPPSVQSVTIDENGSIDIVFTEDLDRTVPIPLADFSVAIPGEESVSVVSGRYESATTINLTTDPPVYNDVDAGDVIVSYDGNTVKDLAGNLLASFQGQTASLNFSTVKRPTGMEPVKMVKRPQIRVVYPTAEEMEDLWWKWINSLLK